MEAIAYDFDGVFHTDITQYKDENNKIQGHTSDNCKNDLKLCNPFPKIISIIKKQKLEGKVIIICTHNPNLDKLREFLIVNKLIIDNYKMNVINKDQTNCNKYIQSDLFEIEENDKNYINYIFTASWDYPSKLNSLICIQNYLNENNIKINISEFYDDSTRVLFPMRKSIIESNDDINLKLIKVNPNKRLRIL